MKNIKTTLYEFLNESVVSELENTTLGLTTFEYKGESYRLNSYLYVYRTTDGQVRYSAVNKKNANAVGGSGIRGCVVDLKDVKFLNRQTSLSDERIEQIELSHLRRVENDKKTYEYLKSLPLGLTEDEYDEYSINFAMDSINNI